MPCEQVCEGRRPRRRGEGWRRSRRRWAARNGGGEEALPPAHARSPSRRVQSGRKALRSAAFLSTRRAAPPPPAAACAGPSRAPLWWCPGGAGSAGHASRSDPPRPRAARPLSPASRLLVTAAAQVLSDALAGEASRRGRARRPRGAAAGDRTPRLEPAGHRSARLPDVLQGSCDSRARAGRR
eukprot:scaffold4233_cov180-Ochromonas_danica.AAC.24